MRRAVAAVLMTVLLGGCGEFTMPPRIEMTGVLETPQGTMTRSGVIGVQMSSSSGIFEHSYVYSRVTGEAVPFHLGGKRWLIMTVDKPGGAWAALAPWMNWSDPRVEKLRDGEKIKINSTPMFIYFSNIDDPKSARAVKVGSRDTVLGPGYEIKGVWMQRTDRPLSRGIRKVMPWIDRFEKEYIQGRGSCFFNDPIPCASRNTFDKKDNV